MSSKSNRTYKYGDQPIRITTVQVVEEQFGGAATAKQVDAYLKERFPHYKDDTHLNLIVNSGNDSNLLIVFYVQIMPDDLVMQLHRF